MGSNPSARRPQVLIAALIFVVSGAAALAYEVVWFKRFAHVWGSSAHSFASVVAAYLLGLGLGASLAGRRADRAQRPLRLYAWCEIGVGLCALVVPLAIQWLYELTAPLYSSLSDSPILFGVARFALTFAVLAPPCMLMGATLPLLVRHFALEGIALGRAAAWLYAFNALGAAAGAWLTGFYLIPEVGLAVANWIAAGTSFAVAAAAWFVSSAPELPAMQRAETLEARLEKPRGARYALFAAAALTGAGSLALQMLWTRNLALAVGGTIYAYTAVLAVFIAGLGLGSLAYRLFFAGRADPLPVITGAIAVLFVGAIVGQVLSPWLGQMAGALSTQRADPSFNTGLCLGASFAIEGLATLAMGALFPALCELAGRTLGGGTGAIRANEARAVGAIYAWNTAGSIPAAVATQLVLFPALNLEGTCRTALALYAVALALVACSWSSPARKRAFAVAAIAGLALCVLPRPADPLVRDRGYYLYGSYFAITQDKVEALFDRAGPTCNVLVVAENEDALPGDPRYALRKRSLHVNGKVDAGTGGDMPTQLAISYYPHILRPRAKNVLVIGMGSGTTAGASLCFPDVRVTACEIEPAVLAATPFFAPDNHSPHLSPNFTARIEDGRGFVQGTREQFDLILSEPSNPWIAGVANLFTLEFYRAVRERLAPGGLLGQWCQTYSLAPADYAMIVRTLAEVFPHVALVRIVEQDTLLLASMEPIVPDRATVDEAQALIHASPEVRADLERWFQTADVRSLLLANLVLDGRGVQRLLQAVGGTTLNTDLNMRLEYDSPRLLFEVTDETHLPVDDAILNAVDVGLLRDLVVGLGCDVRHAAPLRVWPSLLRQAGRQTAAQRAVELALQLSPNDAELLAEDLLHGQSTDERATREKIDRLVKLSRDQAFRVGKALGQGKASARAQPIFERLSEHYPDWVQGWTGLAVVYADLGRREDARAAVDRALVLAPNDELARNVKRALEQAR